ncbi:MAG: hypothetical protein KF911_15070 [Pseudomonadales bacterium]|nr:hypothetical protein [Pseudomonadales bacterium]
MDRARHRRLAWIAGLALLAWGSSGILHTVITRVGPQLADVRPPAPAMDLAGARAFGAVLTQAGVRETRAVRIVATADGAHLQVTESAEAPRRYFDLRTGAERPDYDRAQAIYLARHYLGRADLAVVSARLQQTFDRDYVPVNRLLPVWRIDFADAAGTSVWIYTETGALALASDRTKRGLQRVFELVHTWSWMPPGLEWLRVAVMFALVGCIAITAVLGLRLRWRRRGGTWSGRPGRAWHRRAALPLVVPLFALAGSGLYHLVHEAGAEADTNLTLAPPVAVGAATYPLFDVWNEVTAGLAVAGVSLVALPDGGLYYRLALAPSCGRPEPADATTLRDARFDGVPLTGPAVYLDARTGEPLAEGDRAVALALARGFVPAQAEGIETASLVTRFSPTYDFRNKRLPVWQVDVGAPLEASYFIDTATGVLADVRSRHGRREALVFSYLHKWNFLMPLGRTVQNTVVVGVVGLMVLLVAALGLRLRRGPDRPHRAGDSARKPRGAADVLPGIELESPVGGHRHEQAAGEARQ